MLNSLKPLFLGAFLLLSCSAISQSVYSRTGHEFGIFTGPVQMRSDFGLRGDKATNLGNIGFGIGVLYDINPLDWGNRGYRIRNHYIVEHLKFRFVSSYSRTSLKHYGKFVAASSTSDNSDRLRGQRGTSSNFDLGAGLEFYPISLKHFFYEFNKFIPYGIISGHITYANPTARTTYGDQDITDPNNFYSYWEPGSINPDSSIALSVVTGAGVRYKIDPNSDFIFEFKWQFFNNDWIDGLNHQLEWNKNNDSLLWFCFGYIYYLNK